MFLELKNLHFEWIAKYFRDQKQRKVELKLFLLLRYCRGSEGDSCESVKTMLW